MNYLCDYEDLILKTEKVPVAFSFQPSFNKGSWIKKGSNPDPGWENVPIRDKTTRIRKTGPRVFDEKTRGRKPYARVPLIPVILLKF
jgi:hypothetical protein